MSDLTAKRCIPCEGGVPPLDRDTVKSMLTDLDGWDFDESNNEIIRRFQFKNYYETMAFVNAIAWMAHQEDHHPDLEVGYNRCVVHYSTHAINGLSENDLICAAKVDAIYAQSQSE